MSRLSFNNSNKLSVVLLASLTLASLAFANPDQECMFDGLVGSHPIKLGWLRDKLKAENKRLKTGEASQPNGFFRNRLILYGPPGNGKTTVARKIADTSGSHFIELDGPSVVKQHYGDGSTNIEVLFTQAVEHADFCGQTVVIFMDEIDAIAVNNDASNRTPYEEALQKLWLMLDKYKDDQRILFVCATNHFDKLSKTFKDRFGSNIVEIGYPNEVLRKALLDYFIKKHGRYNDWSKETREALVKQTNEVSIRCIEDFVADAHMVADMKNSGKMTHEIALNTLEESKKKFKEESKLTLSNVNEVLRAVASIITIVAALF